MFYYVYKISNLINGKIYIGKRASLKPNDDSYMGSGKLIKAAIIKYGVNSFKKEILAIVDTDEEASLLESMLVTREFVKSANSYNMHEGGHGGFIHINGLPKQDRPNLKKLAEMKLAGKYVGGGDTSSFFNDSSILKMREGSRKGNEILKNKTDEEKKSSNLKRSKTMSGENNPHYGFKSYTNLASSEKCKFKPQSVPEGWVLTDAYREMTLKNSKRRWFNNGVKSFMLHSDSSIISEKNLVKGRIC